MFWGKKKNPYITLHLIKLRNDGMYNDYLKWCYSLGEIPMDKYDFIKEIAEKENEIKTLTK